MKTRELVTEDKSPFTGIWGGKTVMVAVPRDRMVMGGDPLHCGIVVDRALARDLRMVLGQILREG